MWLAIRKMFMMRKEVNDITMVSESCKRTWHRVWGSIFFCYHERLLKGRKSSLSPPQSLWPNISFFLPLPRFGHNCSVSCKKWQGFSTPCRAFLQRTPTGPAQGEEDPEDGPYGRREHPTEYTAITRSYRTSATWNRDYSSQSTLRNGGKTFPKDPRWQKTIGQTQPQQLKQSGCEDSLARTEGTGVEGTSDLKLF